MYMFSRKPFTMLEIKIELPNMQNNFVPILSLLVSYFVMFFVSIFDDT